MCRDLDSTAALVGFNCFSHISDESSAGLACAQFEKHHEQQHPFSQEFAFKRLSVSHAMPLGNRSNRIELGDVEKDRRRLSWRQVHLQLQIRQVSHGPHFVSLVSD
jgi:hypothetical protein